MTRSGFEMCRESGRGSQIFKTLLPIRLLGQRSGYLFIPWKRAKSKCVTTLWHRTSGGYSKLLIMPSRKGKTIEWLKQLIQSSEILNKNSCRTQIIAIRCGQRSTRRFLQLEVKPETPWNSVRRWLADRDLHDKELSGCDTGDSELRTWWLALHKSLLPISILFPLLFTIYMICLFSTQVSVQLNVLCEM